MPTPRGEKRPIPQPPTAPFVGNLFDLDFENGIESFSRLADEYGPIYRISLPGNPKLVVISSHEYVDECSNEKEFRKSLSRPLVEIRALAGDGLFTAFNDEPNWKLAHSILLPAFGPGAIRGMFDDMVEIASQLVLKWERFGPQHQIDVALDFTRLTLDTIALCAFSYRFNSFYDAKMHPFVDAMVNVLSESGRKVGRTRLQQSVMLRTRQRFQADIAYTHNLCDDLVKHRKEFPNDSTDLLNLMLNGRDKATGKALSEENVRFQMVTFLIAGHETTSGLLSFTVYYLLSHPSALQKAQEEVDRVVGTGELQFQHLAQLKYVDACLKEAIRLQPTAPGYSVEPIAGKHEFRGGYEVDEEDRLMVLLPKLHRDPKIWAPDPEEFRPERMLDGGFENLPKNAWKPFGNGARACIGRPFAWQESLIVMAMVLQKFNLEKWDTSYNLRIKQTLTIKPDCFYMRAHLRRPGARPIMTKTVVDSRVSPTDSGPAKLDRAPAAAERKKLYILFGSNSGSCESFADTIGSRAAAAGFDARVDTLDAGTEAIAKYGGPVVILTPSYEGQPPENARRFFSWLTSDAVPSLAGVNYAVFGAGHHDWASTYQRVPRVIDEQLAAKGAKRILERGEADAGGDLFGDFERWENALWKALQAFSGVQLAAEGNAAGSLEMPAQADALDLEIVGESRSHILGLHGAAFGVVKENRKLTPDVPKHGGRQKRHIEIELPAGMTYKAGDYLALMPLNPTVQIRRALKRFKLTPDSAIIIKGAGKSYLPRNRPVPVETLLAGYVELDEPASRRALRALLADAPEGSKSVFENLAEESYKAEVLDKRVSLLDILEDHADHPISFAQFLALLTPMRMRQYSISSSPLCNPGAVTLTIDVLQAPAHAGNKIKLGVASNYLAGLEPGDQVSCMVKSSAAAFHLPGDPSVPVIMVATGSGMAPMRGFVQERAAMAVAGRKLGRALLYYGCRDEEEFLYREELEKWQALGAVEVRPVFSRAAAVSNEGAPRYVQDRIWQDRAELAPLVENCTTRIYVCGSASRLAAGVEQTTVKIIMETRKVDEDEAKQLLEKLRGVRYATDVFG